MNIQHITQLAHQLQSELPFVDGIHSSKEYDEALLLMNKLTEDYDNNLLLIDVLWPKIEVYEETISDFSEFNQRIQDIDPGASMLRLLMDQHNLKTTDFREEIGVKSVVSMIANEKRKLTMEHIKKLSVRFDISPALFF
jgi:HTH-type transcriptional regulator/antitoxin HigA